jgi:hypothetical protein
MKAVVGIDRRERLVELDGVVLAGPLLRIACVTLLLDLDIESAFRPPVIAASGFTPSARPPPIRSKIARRSLGFGITSYRSGSSAARACEMKLASDVTKVLS